MSEFPSHQRLSELIERVLRGRLHPDVLNHSLRVLAIAQAEARHTGWGVNPAELTVAALFHDTGTIPDASDLRFEVAGAERACRFAREQLRLEEDACDRIWHAIALHTSPGLAEYAGPLTRAVRAGVVADFGDAAIRGRHAGLVAALERRYPRGTIEATLSGAVIRAAIERPAKAPRTSWPHDLVAGHRMAPEAPVNPFF